VLILFFNYEFILRVLCGLKKSLNLGSINEALSAYDPNLVFGSSQATAISVIRLANTIKRAKSATAA